MPENLKGFAELGCEVEFAEPSENFSVAIGAISYGCLLSCLTCVKCKEINLEAPNTVRDVSLRA